MKAILYQQTGFNSVDIPDSIELLQNGQFISREYQDINIVQNDYLSFLKVGDINYYEARKIDYVVIEDPEAPITDRQVCYTVNRFEMLSEDVCKFELLIDPYNTIGGFGATSGNLIVAGSANRMSVSLDEDNANFYTLDEPFRPAERIKISLDNLNKPRITNYIGIVESVTVPPQTVEPKVKVDSSNNIIDVHSNFRQSIMGTTTGDYVIKQQQSTPAGNVVNYSYGMLVSPKSRSIKGTTLINNSVLNEISFGTGTQWWEHALTFYEITVDGKTIKGDLIGDFRDNGKELDVINFWQIPDIYINRSAMQSAAYSPTAETEVGGITQIKNNKLTNNLVITPRQVYNNKARYSQSITIKVVSPVSGAQLDKKIYEVINTDNLPSAVAYSIGWYVFADLRPLGTPIFMFRFNNGAEQTTDKIFECINGGTWRKIPLAATGVSNKNYENARINQQANVARFQSGMQLGISGIGFAIAAATAPATGGASLAIHNAAVGTAAASLVSGIKGFANASYNQSEQQRLLNLQGEQASVQITVGNSDYLRDINENYFVAVIASYSDNDMYAYDTFLTKFGYNVGNKPITNADFYSRPAFNYMRVNDITIESVNAGINMINKVKEQLQAGVRIWHKKPTPEDMFASGNRTNVRSNKK